MAANQLKDVCEKLVVEQLAIQSKVEDLDGREEAWVDDYQRRGGSEEMS